MDRQIPPEIIQLIVEASLDPYNLFDFDPAEPEKRYSTLKKYSLLNSTWRGVSEPLLYKWVVILSEKSALSFLEVAESSDSGMVQHVRDLCIGMEVPETSSLARILWVVTKVVNLSLTEVTLDVEDLTQLRCLRRLEIDNVEIIGSLASSTLSLPSLRRLHLYQCTVTSSASHFLTPSFLPSLRHLQLCDSRPDLDSLIPQLEAISFDSYDYPALSGAKSLLLLHFPPYVLFRPFSRFPSFPSFLSIDYVGFRLPAYHAQEAINALEHLLANPTKCPRVVLLRDIGIGETAEALIKQLEGRAIRITREAEKLDFDGAIIAMERILAEEKRAADRAELRKG